MSARRIVLAMLAALVVLAGCDSGRMPTFQGWVEAELIFVGPDESGRIETLTVREGDQVELRQLLFTLDTELQPADVAMREAEVKNAQQAYDRAAALVKSMSGTQKALDDAEAALRTAQAQAQLRADQAGAPQGVQPRRRQRPADLLPRAANWCRPASRSSRILPPGNLKVRFFVNEATLPTAQVRRPRLHPLRRLRPRYHRQDQLHLPHVGIHAAGDLQHGRALQARVPDRSAAGAAGAPARRASRSASRWGRNSDAAHPRRRPRSPSTSMA